MTAGEIVLVNFQGAKGIKRRPTVVVSTDSYNQTSPDVVLAVITTQIDSANLPTDYCLRIGIMRACTRSRLSEHTLELTSKTHIFPWLANLQIGTGKRFKKDYDWR